MLKVICYKLANWQLRYALSSQTLISLPTQCMMIKVVCHQSAKWLSSARTQTQASFWQANPRWGSTQLLTQLLKNKEKQDTSSHLFERSNLTFDRQREATKLPGSWNRKGLVVVANVFRSFNPVFLSATIVIFFFPSSADLCKLKNGVMLAWNFCHFFCTSIYFITLFDSIFHALSFCLPLYLSVSQSVCFSVSLSLYLPIFLSPFEQRLQRADVL